MKVSQTTCVHQPEFLDSGLTLASITLLGHQQSRLTTDLYGHGSADRLRDATGALSRLLFPPNAVP